MFDNEIVKLKNKIGKKEKVLFLNNPINNEKSLSLIEKRVLFFSSFIMLISLFFVFLELYKFYNHNEFTDVTESKYIQNKTEEKKTNDQNNLYKLYQKLSISKKIIHIANQKKSQDTSDNILKNQINLQEIASLNNEIQSLEKIINNIKNEKREILDEYNILSTKNILLDKTSRKLIVKLEENLAALSSKTKIQNHKLSTALSMIDNLQLERINLLSKLNLPNKNENELAELKQ